MKLYYIIIIGFLCLIIGIGLGYSAKSFDMEKQNILDHKNKNVSALLNIEKSPLLYDIKARLKGEVIKMDEKSLLIKKEDNSFETKIGDFPLRIIKIIYDSDGKQRLGGEDLKSEDVKIGDQVKIRCILQEGDWQLIDIAIEEFISESQKEN